MQDLYLLSIFRANSKQCYFPDITCCVDVKIRGFIGHIAHRFQTWPTGLHLVRISQCFRHIYQERASVNVLSSKQHLHLEEDRNIPQIELLHFICHLLICQLLSRPKKTVTTINLDNMTGKWIAYYFIATLCRPSTFGT